MDIDIGEINSKVRTVDNNSLLSPEVMRKIVAAVVKAMKDSHEHEKRVDTERKLTQGVWAESAEEQP